MLKITFLVAFCGLLVQMTQAEPMSANCMPVWLSPKIFAPDIGENMNPSYLVPTNVGDVTDPASSNALSGVKLQGPPTVSVNVTTTLDGSLKVTCIGQGKYTADLVGKTSQKGVSCDMSTSVQMVFQIEENDGFLKCGKMPSKDEVNVQAKSKPNRPFGLLQILIDLVITLLTSVLQVLDILVNHLIDSNVAFILDSITNSLDGIFKILCGPKDLGDGLTCTHTIMQKPTVDNNCMKLVVKSVMTAPGGMPPSAPVETYEPPTVVPVEGSVCTFPLTESFMNSAVKTIQISFDEVTEELKDLSTKVQGMCGGNIVVSKIFIKAIGSPQVEIHENGLEVSLACKVLVYIDGIGTPFIEATGTLHFMGKVEVNLYGIQLICLLKGIGELKSVTKPNNCDVASEVSAALLTTLKGTFGFSISLGASPMHNINVPVTTDCISREGYVLINQIPN